MLGKNPLRDKIISSICEMDMRMLDVLLPDNGVYENAYKEVWLGKLGAFYKACVLRGDTSLIVRSGHCKNDDICDCDQNIWVFEALKSGSSFALTFITEGDQVTGIERCQSYPIDDKQLSGELWIIPAHEFMIYDNEKIGFIASYEFKQLKKDLMAFKADLIKPRRGFVGPLWIRRKADAYNSLYFDVAETPYFIENKEEMLKIYQDLFALRDLFYQQKEYQSVLYKYQVLMYGTDHKAKLKALKWLLKNIHKAAKFVVKHFELSFIDDKLYYVFQASGQSCTIRIRHPKVKLDVVEFMQFQQCVSDLIEFFTYKFIEEERTHPWEYPSGALYLQFKDRLVPLMEEFDEWSKE